MRLIPNGPVRPWNRLHDNAYAMDLRITPLDQDGVGPSTGVSLPAETASATAGRGGQKLVEAGFTPLQPLPGAGQPVRLTFTPRRVDGSVVTDLDVVHTKKLHLIIVGGDLAFFDHVHPEPQPDGRLTLDYIFPKGGAYLLFADLTPRGDRNQVFRLPVTVMGAPATRQPLAVTPTQAKLFGDYRVTLRVSPSPPVAREETHLTFAVEENGVPVTDIEPFLGAGGHCVIVSEDTQSYLHSHPLAMGGSRFGPEITFHTTFPQAGRYKVWGQFQHCGKPLTADFVLEVGRP